MSPPWDKNDTRTWLIFFVGLTTTCIMTPTDSNTYTTLNMLSHLILTTLELFLTSLINI